MLFGANLILLWIPFLAALDGNVCPTRCDCTALPSTNIKTNCSHRDLTSVPVFPDTTEELYLHNNHLTSIPPGAFDNLLSLAKLDLSQNPLHCDCNIRFLTKWLEIVGLDSGAKCVTPPDLNGTSVGDLGVTQTVSCSPPVRPCSHFLVTDVFLFIFLFSLLFLMIWCLRTLRTIRFKIKVNDVEVNLNHGRSLVIGSIKRRFQVSGRS
ncbi:hypothetical protein GDO86_019629 [Hymenochirus boettgeri]|uniref:LRRCT domain-containing protein n=1 Tax=Hymenochirus boettgeri TaxID=247094 RepID=A0A8T2IG37_9PIPI|nr:hypothetical protein GDO86_019629 [Hymenochirus boettgeri]